MEFKKYQHVERYGTEEVEGIELGICYIFPKIDGTNSSVWIGDDGEIHAGSRNRSLTLDQDNANFYETIKGNDNIKKLLLDNPNLRLYGEWLVPHSLKTYRNNAWKHFYIFDVTEHIDGQKEERYLPYDEYREICEKYNVDYIPPLAIIKNPSYEQITHQLDANTYLIDDGKGAGEGVVIKRYDYRNKYGRVTWAKIVRNEFKEAHAHVMKHGNDITNGPTIIEEKIVDKYITQSLCEKTYAKIVNEKGPWKSQYIPILLNMVYHDMIEEDMWHIVKEFKNPIIHFNTLQTMSYNKVKDLMSKLF